MGRPLGKKILLVDDVVDARLDEPTVCLPYPRPFTSSLASR